MSKEYDLSVRYNPGDKVKVLRKANSFENDWGDMWVTGMDNYIGNIYTVKEDAGNNGVVLEDYFRFPHFVLEKVENEESTPKKETESNTKTLTIKVTETKLEEGLQIKISIEREDYQNTFELIGLLDHCLALTKNQLNK